MVGDWRVGFGRGRIEDAAEGGGFLFLGRLALGKGGDVFQNDATQLQGTLDVRDRLAGGEADFRGVFLFPISGHVSAEQSDGVEFRDKGQRRLRAGRGQRGEFVGVQMINEFPDGDDFQAVGGAEDRLALDDLQFVEPGLAATDAGEEAFAIGGDRLVDGGGEYNEFAGDFDVHWIFGVSKEETGGSVEIEFAVALELVRIDGFDVGGGGEIRGEADVQIVAFENEFRGEIPCLEGDSEAAAVPFDGRADGKGGGAVRGVGEIAPEGGQPVGEGGDDEGEGDGGNAGWGSAARGVLPEENARAGEDGGGDGRVVDDALESGWQGGVPLLESEDAGGEGEDPEGELLQIAAEAGECGDGEQAGEDEPEGVCDDGGGVIGEGEAAEAELDQVGGGDGEGEYGKQQELGGQERLPAEGAGDPMLAGAGNGVAQEHDAVVERPGDGEEPIERDLDAEGGGLFRAAGGEDAGEVGCVDDQHGERGGAVGPGLAEVLGYDVDDVAHVMPPFGLPWRGRRRWRGGAWRWLDSPWRWGRLL